MQTSESFLHFPNQCLHLGLLLLIRLLLSNIDVKQVESPAVPACSIDRLREGL
jgi:hypothetical protein